MMLRLPGSRSELREIRETFNCNSFDGQYPDHLIPEFRTTVSCLVGLLTKLSSRLLKCLALSLSNKTYNLRFKFVEYIIYLCN